MIPTTACPVCLSAETCFYAVGRDRLFGRVPGHFRLYRCNDCRCVFQCPLPQETQLAAYYPEEYWWREQKQSRAALLLSRAERAYRHFVSLDHVRFLQACARTAGSSGRALLDIGCGSGTFLHLAHKRGFVPHGMDFSVRAVSAARDQYRIPVRQGHIGSDAWLGHTFDFVTMFHVLEHLTDPVGALSYAGRLLNPGGSLIVQVPNASSVQARFFKQRWYGFDVPRHVINFSARALKILFEKTGFQARVVSRFSLRDNPAALASSIAPGLDPIGRKGRNAGGGALTQAFAEGGYLGLVLLSVPPTWLESKLGHGATLWVHARRCTK